MFPCRVLFVSNIGQRRPSDEGDLSVGMYVTNIEIMTASGTAFKDIFGILVQVQNTFPSLEMVTKLLNADSNVKEREKYSKRQRKKTADLRIVFRKSEREHAAKLGVARIAGIDAMPISLEFTKPFVLSSVGQPSYLNFIGRIEVPQGSLAAVVGAMGCGKTTLLQLIAHRQFPPLRYYDIHGSPQSSWASDHGYDVFVPAHLRIANVADNPMFYAGTLLENLTLGADQEPRARVLKICRRLHISEDVLGYFDVVKPWTEIFSGAQCKLLMIARALVNNAELICIHRPLGRLDSDTKPVIMAALREHVQRKGLYMERPRKFRRPRTVFLSSHDLDVVSMADKVYSVSREGGIARFEFKVPAGPASRFAL